MPVLSAATPMEGYRALMESFVHDGASPHHEFRMAVHHLITKSLIKSWAHDVKMIIRTPYPDDLNLALSGFSMPMRWNIVLDNYTSAEGVKEFLRRMEKQKPWEESFYTCEEKMPHNWGNCLVGIGFHPLGTTQKARVKLVSRSSVIAPVGMVDLGIGVAFVKAIVEAGWLRPDQIELHWEMNTVQVLSWKFILTAYLLGIIGDDTSTYPETNVGRTLARHINSAKVDNHPKLKMFERTSVKVKRLMDTGSYGQGAAEFHPQLPHDYYPDNMRFPEGASTGLAKRSRKRKKKVL